MNFQEFLKELGKQKDCASTQELFKELGGERRMGVALRTFRAVYGGQIPPSTKFFLALFPRIPVHMRKDAVVAFFESSGDPMETKDITNFLQEQVNVTISSDIPSLWSKGEPQLFSERQLQFLASSNDAIRIYHRLVCHEGISESEMKTEDQRKILKKLVELGIGIRTGAGRTVPAKTTFRLPNQDNSPRELVGPGNDVVMRNIPAFIAREGDPGGQEIGFSFQTILREDAVKILEQMRFFKRWVQSKGLEGDHPEEVSFVWLDFGRILKKDRDY